MDRICSSWLYGGQGNIGWGDAFIGGRSWNPGRTVVWYLGVVFLEYTCKFGWLREYLCWCQGLCSVMDVNFAVLDVYTAI